MLKVRGKAKAHVFACYGVGEFKNPCLKHETVAFGSGSFTVVERITYDWTTKAVCAVDSKLVGAPCAGDEF